MARTTITRASALCIIGAVAFACVMAQPAGSAAPSQRKHVALPEEDPNFIALLEQLSERAVLYRKYALGFTCREISIIAKYETNTNDYRKSDRTVYDYLFEEKPGGSLSEVREEVIEEKNGVKRRSSEFTPPMPPAYSWAALFARENRARFHFRPAGQIVKAYRLLTLIDFVGISPNPGGRDTSGWSGRVSLDARKLNLWSVEAEPSGQAVRLEAEIFHYNKAFAIAGVPLASRPHGWSLGVTFGMEVNALSYPTEQSLSMTSLSKGGKMSVEEKTGLKYEGYRFFVTSTSDEELKRSEPPEQPEKPPQRR